MPVKLKPLSQQVLVVTGATSGIGLAAAREAVKAGAAVVLTAGDEPLLRRISGELADAGGRVHPVAADLTRPDDAELVARAAMARFGALDTWINTGAEGGHSAVVNGSQQASEFMREQAGGGAVINVGAAPSDTKGYTDSLRAELRRERAPVSVTLVRRTGAPQAVARAALYAAEHPVQDLSVGSKGRRMTTSETTGLAVGVGAVALALAAAFIARGRISRQARPMIVRAVRPIIVRAATRRPMQTVKLVAKRPRAALRLIKALR
jgi:NAD(P)-dependent dehydrogenase (short-subunit alcohol dehydrogenase family)